MEIVAGIVVFTFGMVFGSFLNVCICRIPAGEDFVRGRSHCMSCGHMLRAADLVPVFSFLLLRGRCRYCGAKISIRYPAVEVLNAAVYLLLWMVYGFGISLILFAAFVSALIVAAFIDADHGVIPNGVVLFLLAVGGFCMVFLRDMPFYARLLGLLAGGLPFWIAYLVSKGGMGLGDVKLSAAAGLVLGWKLSLPALLFSCVGAAVFGLIWARMRKVGLRAAIPFGPFLSAGFGLSLLAGTPLIHWYLQLL